MENNLTKYTHLYKSNELQEDEQQEKRRKLILNTQKENRLKLQDDLRGIKNFIKNLKHHHNLSYNQKYASDYSLQLSEWLKEKPDDLHCWYLIPCPKGQRCLLVSHKGRVEIYRKNCKFWKSFNAILPGTSEQNITILDCFFVEKASTFFILDTLVYNNQDFINCEAQFRFYWIKTKFQENTNFNEQNKFSLIPLEFYDFNDEYSITTQLQRYPPWDDKNLELDGFLFYHKEASYTCGTTPLVGWLFGFMIPEVLQIDVHEEYMNEKPKDYVNYLHFIIEFDEKMAKRNLKRRNKNSSKMESEDDTSNTTNYSCESSNDFEEYDNLNVEESQKILELENELYEVIEE